MEAKWLIARRLCIEKLKDTDRDKVYSEETKQGRMLGSNEIIRMFFDKLRWLCDKSMPTNAMDIFYSEMIPCAPKCTIERQRKIGDKLFDEKLNIGGTQILEHYDSESIVNILHIWDNQMDLADKNLWALTVFNKGENDNIKVKKEVYDDKVS